MGLHDHAVASSVDQGLSMGLRGHDGDGHVDQGLSRGLHGHAGANDCGCDGSKGLDVSVVGMAKMPRIKANHHTPTQRQTH